MCCFYPSLRLPQPQWMQKRLPLCHLFTATKLETVTRKPFGQFTITSIKSPIERRPGNFIFCLYCSFIEQWSTSVHGVSHSSHMTQPDRHSCYTKHDLSWGKAIFNILQLVQALLLDCVLLTWAGVVLYSFPTPVAQFHSVLHKVVTEVWVDPWVTIKIKFNILYGVGRAFWPMQKA